MQRRFVSIWFRHLTTDWFTIRQRIQDGPDLKKIPFVLRTQSHGRMVITAANAIAESHGITSDMVLADARAIIPGLNVEDDIPDLPLRLLNRLAEWCIRFSPAVAVDLPDGLILDATGCSHLWGGDEGYVNDITRKLNARGYTVRIAMADTMTVAWGVARFGKGSLIIKSGEHADALMPLPPEALRLEPDVVERLHKLGLHQVRQFINMPRSSLRRRFGTALLEQLDKALGQEMEVIQPVQPIEPHQERLPCLEPVVTPGGIEIALRQLLENLCRRLHQEQKGLRSAVLKCYRMDGKMEKVEIGTNRPSHNIHHLFKLFEIKLPTIEPGMGIELFVLEAPKVDDHFPAQEGMWEETTGMEEISELIDRLSNKVGRNTICRYLPAEHYWPERSFKKAASLDEPPTTYWRGDKQRPLQLLPYPERVEVTAPIPDYPPMLFRHRGKIHKIVRADGPERIEQEWWIRDGQHRDYYRVEDEEGIRYWLFRLGHYENGNEQWFVHGFFA